MEGRGRSSSIPWDYVNSEHNSPVMMVPGLLMGTGLTLITPCTDPLSADRNITAICRLVIIGGHGSLMTSPRAQNDRHEISRHLHLHPESHGVHSTSIRSPNLIDHKTNPCVALFVFKCFTSQRMLDDTLRHGERGAHTEAEEAETGRAGRGAGDNVICISQPRPLRFVCD